MSQQRKVPELSLKSYIYGDPKEKEAFSKSLFSGLKEYGFIILNDHGVNTDLLDDAYAKLERFFSLPEEVKKSYISPNGGGQRGYTPFGEEHAKDADVHDLKEFWHVGREISSTHPYKNYYPDNVWPSEDHVPDFKNIFAQLYKELDQVGHSLLESLSGPLDLPKDYFDKMVKDGNSILRLLHYPKIPEDADPRCVRAAAHEDINLITILVAASASGLQLKDRDGSWLDVETQKNNLIVDAGDMLSRISNDVIPATTHQVVNPANEENKSRYSMPYFMHPHPEAMLTCIPSCKGDKEKYPPISSHDFLMQRLKEIGLTK